MQICPSYSILQESKHGRYLQLTRILRTSRLLCSEVDTRKSEQESSRLAMVCACYAVFHRLCCMCTDALAGDETEQDGSERGWLEGHRFLGHTPAREACNRIETRFSSKVISSFADGFKSSQRARELANYVAEGETDFVDSGFTTG